MTAPTLGHGASNVRDARWTAFRERRRAAMVEAGLRIVDAAGRVGTEEIAAEAGINRQVLYRYFRDADDVRRGVAARIADDLVSVLDSAFTDATSFEDLIRGMVDNYLAYLEEYPHRLPFLRRTGLPTRGDGDGVEAAVVGRAIPAALRSMGVGDGDRNAVAALAHQVTGLTRRASVRWLRSQDVSREEFRDALHALVVLVIADPNFKADAVARLAAIRPAPRPTEPSAAPAKVLSTPRRDGRRERWNEHRAARRKTLVTAGVAAVDQHGASTNAEEIAQVADVSRTILYRYFKDKEDLRLAVAAEIVEQLVSQVLPTLAAGRTPNEIVRNAVETTFRWFDEHPKRYQFLRARSETGSHPIEDVEDAAADRVGIALRRLFEWFGVEPVVASTAAYGILGMVESSAAWWLAGRPIPLDEAVTHATRGILSVMDGVLSSVGAQIDPDSELPVAALAAAAFPAAAR